MLFFIQFFLPANARRLPDVSLAHIYSVEPPPASAIRRPYSGPTQWRIQNMQEGGA